MARRFVCSTVHPNFDQLVVELEKVQTYLEKEYIGNLGSVLLSLFQMVGLDHSLGHASLHCCS